MRIVVVGSTGHIGSVVTRELAKRHEVIGISRSSKITVDLTDPTSITDMYRQVGTIDAIVSCTGKAAFKPLNELTYADFTSAFSDKAMGQIELVRQGLEHLPDGGSFTITSGILAREAIRTGTAAAAANGALESFVLSAATELPRGQRLNAVSPSVLESAPGYHSAFPGFERVSDEQVARAYVRSIEGVETGRIFKLG
ncbi:short chain dehydrogenase [Glutamicibacter sp. NPDC087344]|uniref:short chain dehydrogenase n=1 Tax=Glutamicibacter sp. NPDC087344 TaxID=3363994 RepID=UPI00380C00B8